MAYGTIGFWADVKYNGRYTNSKLYVRIEWNSNPVPSGNYSDVNVNTYYDFTSLGIQQTRTFNFYKDGGLYASIPKSPNTPWGSSRNVLMYSTSFRVYHDSNGNASVELGVYSDYNFIDSVNGGRWIIVVNGTGRAYLDHIQRYTGINYYNIHSIAETSAQFYWEPAVSMNQVSGLQYMVNDNGNWIGVPVGNYFTVNNLQPYTDYRVKMRALKNDTGLWQESGNVYFKTIGYPSTTLSLDSKNVTSLTFSYTWSYVQPSKVHLYNGNTFLGEFTSSPFTINGLTPNTLYNDLKIFGFGGNGWGPASNSISTSTYPSTVKLLNVTISELKFNSLLATPSIDILTYLDLIEYTVYDSTGTNIVAGPFTTNNINPYLVTGMKELTSYILKTRAKTKISGFWSNTISSSFTTPADQAQVYINNNGTWIKGKAWMKIDGIWTKVKKIYIKNEGNWIIGKNT